MFRHFLAFVPARSWAPVTNTAHKPGSPLFSYGAFSVLAAAVIGLAAQAAVIAEDEAPDASAKVKGLIEKLDSESKWDRIDAVYDLADFSPKESEAAIRPLLDLLKNDPEPNVREAAIGTLGQIMRRSRSYPNRPEGEVRRLRGWKEVVQALADASDAEQPMFRRAALYALWECGALARPVVRQTSDRLLDSNGDVQMAALSLFERHPLEIGPVLGKLEELLTHDELRIRARAIETIAAAGTARQRAHRMLIDVVRRMSGEFRDVGLVQWRRFIRRDQNPAETLRDRLGDGESVARQLYDASSLAARRRFTVKASETLVLLSRHEDAAIRGLAVKGIGFLGTDGGAATEALVERLGDERSWVRLVAVETLQTLGPAAPGAAEALVRVIEDEAASARLRIEAMRALGRVAKQRHAPHGGFADLPPEARPTADLDEATLRRVARIMASALVWDIAYEREEPFWAVHKSGPTDIREAAKGSLAGLGEAGRHAVPTLLDAVERAEDPDTAESLLLSLSEIGPAAERALPAVIEQARAENPKVRRAAVTAVGRIGKKAPQRVLPTLTEALADQDKGVRWAAVETLGEYGDEAAAMLPELEALWPSGLEGEEHRYELARLLGELGSTKEALIRDMVAELGGNHDAILSVAAWGRRAVPHLRSAFQHGGAQQRRAVLGVLSSMKPEAAREASGLMLDGLRDESTRVVQAAMDAIGDLTPEPDRFMPVLIEQLRNEDLESVAGIAASAIAAYGENAAEARGALLDAAERHRGRMQWRLVAALEDVGLDDAAAERLAEMESLEGADTRSRAFRALLGHPRQAAEFVRKYPEALEPMDAIYAHEALRAILTAEDEERAALRRAMLAQPTTPAWMMAWTRDEKYLPRIRKRMEEAGAYRRIFLAACARACGAEPQRIVHASPEDIEPFRPRSAVPGYDPRRGEPGPHGDGTASVLLTGRVGLANGDVPASLRMVRLNDGFLMGRSSRQAIPLRYDADTGRFIAMYDVFAAYQDADGPYETGSALVRIEAPGAEPLTVRLFDEMPHLRVTLAPAGAREGGKRP